MVMSAQIPSRAQDLTKSAENDDATNMNRTILYVHVPKTAGMSFRMIMSSHFSGGEKDVYKLGVVANETRTLQDFIALGREERQQKKMFIGHFPHGMAQHFTAPPIQLTCLRHPVERVISLYEYNKRRGVAMPEFSQWLVSDFEASNGMVKRFNGWLEDHGGVYDYCLGREISRAEQLTQEHLAIAKRHLREEYNSIMISEMFSESLELLRRELACEPLFSLWHNTRNSKPIEHDLAIDVGISEEQSHREQAAAEVNQLDIELYDYFKGELEQAIINADDSFKLDVCVHKEVCRLLAFNNQSKLEAVDLEQRLNQCFQQFQLYDNKQTKMHALELVASRLPQDDQLDNVLQVLKKRHGLH